MRRVFEVTAVVLFSAVAGAARASATTIEFQATDLGGGLWQYEYFLAGGSLLADQGFAVSFDEGLYSTLQMLPPTPQDWDPLVIQPDAGLQSDGIYDALALVDNPPFAGPFSVQFTWLGPVGTTPGSQPFDIYQLDPSGFPNPLQSGDTSPVNGTEVPEPSTLVLLATATALTRALRRRKEAAIGRRASSDEQYAESNA